MNRRNLALGGAATLAALAGVGVAWRQFEPHAGSVNAPQTPPPGTSPTTGAEEAFWALAFDTPDGHSLPMSSFRGKPLLVNFWATWCPPCIEELPLIDSFFQSNKAKGWQVVGLAVDQPSAVRQWLVAKPLSFPVGMAGFAGTELSKTLGNLAGSLPFSVLFGKSGQLLQRRVGKLTAEDLAAWGQLR